MGLRHKEAFVNHGSSSFMGFRHPWAFVTEKPLSIIELRHPWVFLIHGFLSVMDLRQSWNRVFALRLWLELNFTPLESFFHLSVAFADKIIF